MRSLKFLSVDFLSTSKITIFQYYTKWFTLLIIFSSPQRNINTGSRPSIAALAGSIDKNAAQYTFVADISTDTIVATNLKDMMTKTLKKFYVMNNQAKPSAIIMFRSGVSDAEKEKVAGFELDLIEKACKGLEENYR